MTQHQKTNFKIEASWPEKVAAGARDLANIRMEVRGAVLTRVAEVDAGSNRDFLRLSGVSLALWFADNWWRLRWEAPSDGAPGIDWRSRHELSSGSGSSIWPPVMIYGTGRRVVFAPSLGQAPQTGPIRFLEADQVLSIDGSDYERTVDGFFAQVLGSCSKAADANVLKALVSELKEERADGEVARWRRLEARLGFDPDEAPAGLIEALKAAEDRYGEGAIEEAASASAGVRALDDLTAVLSAAEHSDIELNFSFARERHMSPQRSANMQAWQLAEDAAHDLRDYLGMAERPITTRELCDLLQTDTQNFSTASPRAFNMPYGARLDGPAHRDRVAVQSRYLRDRRFEVARMIGDVMWSDNESLGIVSRAKTDRQKFQRAFAQSFLVPVGKLMSEVDQNRPDRDIERMARTFEVHPNVVKTMLVNKNILPRENLADRLEVA